MKLLVLVFIVAILAALGSAMFALIRHRGASDRVVRSLTIRVALSIGLFLLLMLAYWMGWIQPHAVN